MGKLNSEPQPEVRSGQAKLVLADLVEEASAIPQNYRDAGDGIPDRVAKPAQSGEIHADLVPVRMQSHVVGRSNGQQALGRRGNGAGVGYIQLQSGSGSKRLRQRDCRLV